VTGFGPIVLIFFLLNQISPGFLAILDTIIGVIGIPLLVLLVWFSHQTTKRFAYWHLSLFESFKDTFKTLWSYLGLILPLNKRNENKD
jgi:hypothetical protein